MNSLVILNNDKQYDMQLICLPYAGSISNVFDDWPSKLLGVEVCVAPYPDLEQVATTKTIEYSSYFKQLLLDCRSHIKKKFVIFGHSMGAMLAYNLAKSLEEYGLFPEFVVFSGSCSPFAVNEDEKKMHLLSDKKLIEFLKRQNSSLDDKILRRSFFTEMYLPKLRLDMQIMGKCIIDCQKKYDRIRALSCDIYAFGSEEDEDTTQKLLNTWNNLTKKSFYTKIFPGNHFYIHEYSDLLLKELKKCLDN